MIIFNININATSLIITFKEKYFQDELRNFDIFLISSVNLAVGVFVSPLVYPTSTLSPWNVKSTKFNNLSLKYHMQLVNHDDINGTRSFVQRYLEDCQFHKQEGLVPQFIANGSVKEIAEANDGCLIYPEHRYMGLSLPFPNLTLKNLEYVKVRQTLADLAHLIKTLKKNETRFRNSKVILVGPSLSGTLVSWFRLKYPELSAGGWASSGPVLVKADVPEHKVELGQVFERFGGKMCYNKIQDGFMEIEEDLSKEDITRIRRYLKLCDGFDPKFEKNNMLFVYTLGALVSSTNQHYVKYMCDGMINTEDNIEVVAVALNPFLTGGICLNMNYNETLAVLQDEYDSTNSRAFLYLACYEYGW